MIRLVSSATKMPLSLWHPTKTQAIKTVAKQLAMQNCEEAGIMYGTEKEIIATIESLIVKGKVVVEGELKTSEHCADCGAIRGHHFIDCTKHRAWVLRRRRARMAKVPKPFVPH